MVTSRGRVGLPVLILMCVIGAILFARLSTMALSHAWQASSPSLAASLYAHNVEARLRLSSSLLSLDPPQTGHARERAREALIADPLSAGALYALAIAADEEGRRGDAITLIERASQLTLRPDAFRVWALSNALRQAKYEEALEVVERVYKSSGGILGPLERLLPSLIVDASGVEATAKALSRNPDWRGLVLTLILRHGQLQDQWYALYERLSSTQAPPTVSETRAFLNALVQRGALNHAEALWLLSLRSPADQENGLFPNADFANGLPNSPFDWTVQGDPRTAVHISRESRRRVLNIDFFGGRVATTPVARLMALPPGDYVLSGVERASSFSTPRGLVWRVTCRGRSAALGETEPMRSDTPWRRLELKFSVPDDCPYQALQLSLLARVASEQEVRGVASYADFSLARQAP